MKLNIEELFTLRESLHAGIELRKEALNDLLSNKYDYSEKGKQTCIEVDKNVIERMENLLERMSKELAKQNC